MDWWLGEAFLADMSRWGKPRIDIIIWWLWCIFIVKYIFGKVNIFLCHLSCMVRLDWKETSQEISRRNLSLISPIGRLTLMIHILFPKTRYVQKVWNWYFRRTHCVIKHAWVCQYDNDQDQHEIYFNLMSVMTATLWNFELWCKP